MRVLEVMSLFLCLAHGVRIMRRPSSRRNLFGGPNISIVNGVDAKECTWKHQVSLQDRLGHYCGGTIVAPNWVLTAAHCKVVSTDKVVAGEWNLDRSSNNMQTKSPARVFNHPKYNSKTTDHDFALVKLDSPLKMTSCVGTASLPKSDVAAGTKCWITGWGTLYEDGPGARILQEVEVSTQSNRDCQNSGYASSDITAAMLCAQGSRNGKITDACQGDSGGPLVCGSSGSWTVYGATSWGSGCAEKDYPGVWARVHYVRSWIESTMGSDGGPSPSPTPPSPSPPSPPSPPGNCAGVPKVQCKASSSCRWRGSKGCLVCNVDDCTGV